MYEPIYLVLLVGSRLQEEPDQVPQFWGRTQIRGCNRTFWATSQ
jgi:hypothetical protein